MTTARTLALLALSLPLVGCASVAASSEPSGAATQAKDDGKAAKQERALEYAKLKLELASMKAEGSERSQKEAVARAADELEEKAGALKHFQEVEAPLAIDESELSLRRANQRVVESEQEITELESMYAQEDFAETTKELVLTRGRAQLEMARSNLELAQRRLDKVKGYEHPKREKELGREVQRAEQGLAKAELEHKRGVVQRRLEMLEAENAVKDAADALEGEG